jgi:drug/metabolite transporter (DMT)-like permease
MSLTRPPSRWSVIFAFALVYVFWGSTYLGIDIAIQSIPPPLMCGIRFSIAGLVLLAYCYLRGQNIRYSPRQLAQLAIVGILLLMGGNLTLAYAEEYVPSGLAALLVAVTPLWLLVLDALLLGTHRISQRGLVGLALGIAGSAILICRRSYKLARWGERNSGFRWRYWEARSVGRWVQCFRSAGSREHHPSAPQHGR